MPDSPSHIPGGPHVDDATAALLARRYGAERDPARRRRGVIAAVVALVVLLVAYAVGAGLLSGRDEVVVQHVGQEILDPSTALVRFNVTARAGDTLTCTLTAVSEHFTQVGYVEIPVGPLTADTVAVEGLVTTVEPAASATVEGCSRD